MKFTSARLVFGSACLLVWSTGCEPPESASKMPGNGTSARPKQETTADYIRVRDGKIETGRPRIDEQVEREIYASLNFRRKMISAIQAKGGSQRGIQQMQEELETLTQSFMVRYSLSRQEVLDILRKGDHAGWGKDAAG